MLWKYRKVTARIWSNDHCPPHVTFVCMSDGWSARVEFSMVCSQVSLMDIKPVRNAPSIALVNELMEQLLARLSFCRQEWWAIQQTICLDNKVVTRVVPGEVRLGRSSGCIGGIVPKTGKFQENKVTAQVRWVDGCTTTDTVSE